MDLIIETRSHAEDIEVSKKYDDITSFSVEHYKRYGNNTTGTRFDNDRCYRSGVKSRSLGSDMRNGARCAMRGGEMDGILRQLDACYRLGGTVVRVVHVR